jgi:hypothetical protein
MVDAWTQTSNRGSDNEQNDKKKDKSKDEGTQAQAKDLNESNVDVSPTRHRYQIQNNPCGSIGEPRICESIDKSDLKQ